MKAILYFGPSCLWPFSPHFVVLINHFWGRVTRNGNGSVSTWRLCIVHCICCIVLFDSQQVPASEFKSCVCPGTLKSLKCGNPRKYSMLSKVHSSEHSERLLFCSKYMQCGGISYKTNVVTLWGGTSLFFFKNTWNLWEGGWRTENRFDLVAILHRVCCGYLGTESNNDLTSNPRTSNQIQNGFVVAIFFLLITINFRGMSDGGNSSLEFRILQISKVIEHVFYFTELNCSQHKRLHA